MKKSLLLISVSVLVLLGLLFSCTNKVVEGVVSELKLTVQSNIEVDKYVLSIEDKNGSALFKKEFDVKFEPRMELRAEGLNLKAGEYKIVVVGLANNTPVVSSEMVKRLEPGLNSETFVLSVQATLDVEYYSRAEHFKPYIENNQLVLRYKPEDGATYKFYALVSAIGNPEETWIPLDGASGETEETSGEYKFKKIPITDDKIEFKDSKGRVTRILPVEQIKLVGVNVTKDGKPSGICPAPIIEQEIELGGRVRSTPAVWQNPDDSKIYVFTTADDGKLRVFEYKDGELEERDSQYVGCFGLMSPVVDEEIHEDRHYVNVYVAGNYNESTGMSTVYKYTFDPVTHKKLVLTGSEDVDGKVESTPVFVNGHLFVTTYAGKGYVIRPTDMSKVGDPLNLGNERIVTSPAAVDNNVYVIAPDYDSAQDKIFLKLIKVDLSNPLVPDTETIMNRESFYRGSTDAVNKAATASSPAYDNVDKTIYFGSMDGVVYKVDTNNNTASTFNLTLGRIDGSPVIDNDGNIYVGTDAGYVVKLDSNGDIKWKYYTGNDVRGKRDAVRSTPLLGSDGLLYVGSYDGYIYALRQIDGQIVWRYQAMDRVWGSPTLLPEEGKLLVGGHDGKLYMIRVTANNIQGRWPKWKNNLLNN